VLALQESSEVAGVDESVTLVGVSVHISPEGFELETLSATVPVKPLTLLTVMVEFPNEPAFTVRKV
jgi:hypothetical protein